MGMWRGGTSDTDTGIYSSLFILDVHVYHHPPPPNIQSLQFKIYRKCPPSSLNLATKLSCPKDWMPTRDTLHKTPGMSVDCDIDVYKMSHSTPICSCGRTMCHHAKNPWTHTRLVIRSLKHGSNAIKILPVHGQCSSVGSSIKCSSSKGVTWFLFLHEGPYGACRYSLLHSILRFTPG